MYLTTLNNFDVNDIETGFTLEELDGEFKTKYLNKLAISFEFTNANIIRNYFKDVKINIGDKDG